MRFDQTSDFLSEVRSSLLRCRPSAISCNQDEDVVLIVLKAAIQVQNQQRKKSNRRWIAIAMLLLFFYSLSCSVSFLLLTRAMSFACKTIQFHFLDMKNPVVFHRYSHLKCLQKSRVAHSSTYRSASHRIATSSKDSQY